MCIATHIYCHNLGVTSSPFVTPPKIHPRHVHLTFYYHNIYNQILLLTNHKPLLNRCDNSFCESDRRIDPTRGDPSLAVLWKFERGVSSKSLSVIKTKTSSSSSSSSILSSSVSISSSSS
mmetsp:Transcript_21283/g.38142  ORF Transcript_21283/g.38142 Transcript_21283/m.38142 type:complete len:120 (+) Transcript_21283:313-672(+)